MGQKWLFIPFIAGKPWNGNTVLSEPLGGSEASVAYLAQAISRLGNDVAVVTHGQPVVDFAGVTYYHQTQISTVEQLEWDVVVSSRWPEALEHSWKTKKRVLWLHDMPHQEIRTSADVIVCISKFQADAYQFREAEGEFTLAIIGDGVDDTLMRNITAKERNENHLLWISNPDRGTAVAALIFQKVRERWPQLELHIYGRAAVYGWGPEAEVPYLPRLEHMENVFIHEPLPRAQLLRKLAESWAMFYPTFWPETYCMAALESQAAGTPVIAPPFGALTETVKGGILTYDFLNAISQLRNKRRWEKLSVQGIEWARTQTWNEQARRWMEVLK